MKEKISYSDIEHFFKNINIVLLSPHGRSGSIFLQSLFDGNPEVYTLPGYLINPVFFNYEKDLSKIIDLFIKNNRGLFYVYKTMFCGSFSDNKHLPLSMLEIDANQFKNILLEFGRKFNIENNVDFVIAVHFVFMQIKGIDYKKIKTLIIHIHDYEQDLFLMNHTIKNICVSHEVFLSCEKNNVKMIATTRHPLESYFSFSKISKNINIDFFLKINFLTLKCYYYLTKNILKHGKERFYMIDLGDLHKSHKKYLLELCQFIGIQYHDSMEHSTINGYDWYGISANHSSSNTFDVAKSVLKYPDVLMNSDYKDYFCMLNLIFSKVIEFMNFRQDKYSIFNHFKSVLIIFFRCFFVSNFQKKTVIREHLVFSRSYKYFSGFLNQKTALILSYFFNLFLNSRFISQLNVAIGRLELFFKLFLYKFKISISLDQIRGK